jgi:hypothetical protein
LNEYVESTHSENVEFGSQNSRKVYELKKKEVAHKNQDEDSEE